MRDLGRPRTRRRTVGSLDGVGDGEVQALAAQERQPREQRLADELVRERVVDLAVALLGDDDLGRLGLLDDVEQAPGVDVGRDRFEERERERADRRPRRPRGPVGTPDRGARAGGPTTSRTLSGTSSSSTARSVRNSPDSSKILPLLDEVPEHLLDEERVALGLVEHGVDDRVGRYLAGERGDHHRHCSRGRSVSPTTRSTVRARTSRSSVAASGRDTSSSTSR